MTTLEPSSRSHQSSESYDEVTVTDDESSVVEEVVVGEDAISLDDLLQEKNAKIEALEKSNRLKDEHLEQLQRQLNETQIKHKDGIFWFQIELDNARRDKEATEEQMGELYNDLQDMTKSSARNPSDDEEPVAHGHEQVVELQQKLRKYEQALAMMGNQINMVKTSAGEVVKTLKEEIADLMEDRASMELDLLNQLASLNNSKSTKELQYSQELQVKNQTIQRLRSSSGGTATTSEETTMMTAADVEEYEAEIARLMDGKKRIEEQLMDERDQADKQIHQLEAGNARLERRLDQSEEDLAMLQSGGSAQDMLTALELVASEREDVASYLEQVASIWEKADAAVLAIEDVMDQLRPNDDTPMEDEREQLLSTLETSSLIHGQVKVSLLLIELKLRNQLHSLKNDRLSMTWAAPRDDNVMRHMQAVQGDAMKALAKVEATVLQQIHLLEERALSETKTMKGAIEQRSEQLEVINLEHKQLEEQIRKLKSTNSESTNPSLPQKAPLEESKSDGLDNSSSTLTGISKPVIEQLHTEVLRIVERVKEKNSLIEKLRNEIEERKVNEARLKNELKRAVRRASGQPEATKQAKVNATGHTPVSPTAEGPISPLLRTPKRVQKKLTANSSPRSTMKSPVKTSSPIAPLRPSPREVSKPRVGLALSSPTKPASP